MIRENQAMADCQTYRSNQHGISGVEFVIMENYLKHCQFLFKHIEIVQHKYNLPSEHLSSVSQININISEQTSILDAQIVWSKSTNKLLKHHLKELKKY